MTGSASGNYQLEQNKWIAAAAGTGRWGVAQVLRCQRSSPGREPTGGGTEAKSVEIDVPHPGGNTDGATASLGLRTPGGSQSGLTLAVL
jgi:hypothetical protein